MAKHRRMSEGSRRARTVIGGLAAGSALAAFAPAGMAAAAAGVDENGNPPKGTKVEADSPAYSVGRDNLHNPAPGLRAAQTLGDQVFNNDTDINKTLNGSPLGTAYHDTFGTRGNLEFNSKTGKYEYTAGSGKEGSFKGVLNTTPADQLGNVLPVRECNVQRDAASGAPVFGVRQCT